MPNNGDTLAQWPFDDFCYYVVADLAMGGTWGGQRGIDNSQAPWNFEISQLHYQPLCYDKFMPHDEISQLATPPDGSVRFDPEKLLGLAEDVKFADALAEKLRSEQYNKEARVGPVLEAHGIHVESSCGVGTYALSEFTETDWETIRNSKDPLLTLHAAANYHRQVGKIEHVAFGSHRRNDPRTGYDGLRNQAEIESLPLIHGMSAASFVQLAEGNRPMQSNKGRYRDSGQDALTFHGTQQGATNFTDRELGLDQYVFFDFGRPAAIHRQQAEITLVVDPAVMDQPGVFMTEQDIADTSSTSSYVFGLTTPEYFRETALLRIYNTATETGVEARQGYTIYNNIHSWRSGQDGDFDTLHRSTFSTYEVKIPDGGVPIEAVRRVVVRDEATFNHLQETMGDRFEFVHATLRQGGGIKADYEGDARDMAARDDGNYKEVLQIPGLYEQKLEELLEADYQERVAVLDSLPEDQKEQALVVFGKTEPDLIDATDPAARITNQTNPYKYSRRGVAVYPSMDALRRDVEETQPEIINTVTAAGQDAWFLDTLSPSGVKSIQTPSGTCVLATVERSKQNPRITRLVDAREFSLDELAA